MPRASSSSNGLSDADRALAAKAAAAGTTFNTREDAVSDFRAKHASEYTSSFPTEPARRPDYIPQSTNVGGDTVVINYYPDRRGYGYYRGSSWYSYDPFMDSAMADRLMYRHNYYYGPQPVAAGSSSFVCPCVGFLLMAIVMVIVIVVVVRLARQARSQQVTVGYVRPTYAGGPPLSHAAPPPSPGNRPPPSGDPTEAGFWQNIKVGTIITLSDELAVKESLEKTGSSDGISYTVRAVRRIQEARQLSQWVMLHLQGNYAPFMEERLWMVAKIVDDKLELLVYEPVKDLRDGNRKDFVERGDIWLFQKPDDPQHIVYNRLRYTMDITRNVQAEGGATDLNYTQKPQGELQGSCTEEPPRTGLPSPLLATVVEYVTDQQCDNPELFLLELGSDGDEGGAITLMEGGPINMAEVSVL